MLSRRTTLLGCAVLIAAALVSGCMGKDAIPDKTGLYIYNWSAALGGEGADNEMTRYSYSFYLTNEGPKDVYVKWAEPVLGQEVEERALEGDFRVDLDKAVPPGEGIEIKGQIIFDTKGLSKEQITELEPFVTGLRISTEEIIDLSRNSE